MRKAQRKNFVCTSKGSQMMPFREIISAHRENLSKQVNTVGDQTA